MTPLDRWRAVPPHTRSLLCLVLGLPLAVVFVAVASPVFAPIL